MLFHLILFRNSTISNDQCDSDNNGDQIKKFHHGSLRVQFLQRNNIDNDNEKKDEFDFTNLGNMEILSDDHIYSVGYVPVCCNFLVAV